MVVRHGSGGKDEKHIAQGASAEEVSLGVSLRVCRHLCVTAVLFYITNCLGSTRWQAAGREQSGRQGSGIRGRRQGVV